MGPQLFSPENTRLSLFVLIGTERYFICSKNAWSIEGTKCIAVIFCSSMAFAITSGSFSPP